MPSINDCQFCTELYALHADITKLADQASIHCSSEVVQYFVQQYSRLMRNKSDGSNFA